MFSTMLQCFLRCCSEFALLQLCSHDVLDGWWTRLSMIMRGKGAGAFMQVKRLMEEKTTGQKQLLVHDVLLG